MSLQKSSIKSGASRIRSGVELIYRSFDVIVNASICRARSLGSEMKSNKIKRTKKREKISNLSDEV
jgi:ABC-type uncharacterized transport system ATPase subunit